MSSRPGASRALAVAVPALFAAGCFPNNTFIAPEQVVCDATAPAPSRLRIASYNLRTGLETSLDQVGDVIRDLAPDVIALQEVDRNVDRTGRVDQAQALAARLGYEAIYAAAMNRGGGSYGIALLTRLRVAKVQRVEIPAFAAYEPRVAIDATLCVGEDTLEVAAVHADFLPWSASRAGAMLARRLSRVRGQGVIVAGDFNETPGAAGPRTLTRSGFTDVLAAHHEGPTFWPNGMRIDYLFMDSPLADRVVAAGIGDVKASDHYPVFADLDLQGRWKR